MAWYTYQQHAAFNASTAVNNEFIRGSTYNHRVVGGSTTLDGSSGSSIVTGLSGIHAFSVNTASSVHSTTAPTQYTFTVSTGSGTALVYPWNAASSVDTTPTASTSTGDINWIALGI